MVEVSRLIRPRERAYDELRRAILLNELKPGEALTELGLAARLGCSQGTVREALLHLREDGLVTRSGRRGTSVTRLEAEEAAEILALRRRIETRGAVRAAAAEPEAHGRALARLRDLERAMESAADDGDEAALTGYDITFHQTLFALSGLEALEQILTRCALHAHRWRLWAPSHRRPLLETARRHRVLIDRLATRDGEGLARAVGAHIDTIVTDDTGRSTCIAADF